MFVLAKEKVESEIELFHNLYDVLFRYMHYPVGEFQRISELFIVLFNAQSTAESKALSNEMEHCCEFIVV